MLDVRPFKGHTFAWKFHVDVTHLFTIISHPFECEIFAHARAVIHVGLILLDHEGPKIQLNQAKSSKPTKK
jgi:hypothetical protein